MWYLSLSIFLRNSLYYFILELVNNSDYSDYSFFMIESQEIKLFFVILKVSINSLVVS